MPHDGWTVMALSIKLLLGTIEPIGRAFKLQGDQSRRGIMSIVQDTILLSAPGDSELCSWQRARAPQLHQRRPPRLSQKRTTNRVDRVLEPEETDRAYKGDGKDDRVWRQWVLAPHWKAHRTPQYGTMRLAFRSQISNQPREP